MTESTIRCVACGRDNHEIPLIQIDFNDQKYWICPQDFPTLIHQPDRLVGRLPGAERLSPGRHEH